ncbi:Protein DedA [Paraconexibacter sp. AEG42_29]|uniref:Protein DedA n=1 Tax=Paraconexibacter sp. AEG42_29 TaxID=2997339 RepID=A0AAU7AW94_9ACTN
MLDWLPDPLAVLRDLAESAGYWTYAIVAGVVLLETSVGLGILSPGEAVLAVAGAASTGSGSLDLVALLAIVWVAGMIGDGCSYRLGRRYGPGLLLRLRIPRRRIAHVHQLLADRGGVVLVGGRFVGPVRVFAPFLAGSSAMTGRRFLAWDALGVAVWGWSYVLIGYAFAGSVDGASSTFGRAGAVLVCAVVVLALIVRRRSRARDAG